MTSGLVVCESVVGSCFNIRNCAYLRDWLDFRSTKCLPCCEQFFGQNLLLHLKQSGGKLKGGIWMLDWLSRPNVESSRKRDLPVRRTWK